MAKPRKAPRRRRTAPDLAAALEAFFAARAARLEADREAKRRKAVELERQAEAQAAMGAAGLVPTLERPAAARCGAGLLTLKLVRVWKPEDWPAFYAWVGRTKNFEALERRLHQSQLFEIVEHHPALARRGIPGLALERVVKVSASAPRGSR